MRGRLYATAPRLSRVIVVDLDRVPGDGILGTLGTLGARHRRRYPDKRRRRSCSPKGAGASSEREAAEDEEDEAAEAEEARHVHREGLRGRPAANTVNRGWRTTAKCE